MVNHKSCWMIAIPRQTNRRISQFEAGLRVNEITNPIVAGFIQPVHQLASFLSNNRAKAFPSMEML